MSTYLKKTICLLLIIFVFMMPFFGFTIKKAEAANSVAVYIKELSPLISKMPGCQKALGSGITDLFKKVKDLFSSKGSGSTDLAPSTPTEAGFSDSGGGDATVPTTNAKQEKLTSEGNKKLDAAAKSQENIDNAQNCTNGIGKAIAKVLVNKATDSIINWVNTGDAGNPLFVQDQGAYFKNIAEEQILAFGEELKDPEKFPYGKAFMQTQANSYKNKFANNAQYSLNEMIINSNPNYSAETFRGDFSQGGWDAWDAMTQNPANNPLGFSLMASNEIGKRIEVETNLAKGSLQMGSGFLGVKECSDPIGVTKSQDELGREERKVSPTGPYENPICTGGFIDVTPGKFVGDQLVSSVQKKDNALMDVSTLNDAMAAILDSVLAKFTSTLQTEGISNIKPPVNDEYYAIDPQAQGFGTPQNEQDYSKAQINASKWIKDHPDFNIRTDFNQALIDEQRIYADKLKEQNKELYSLVSGSLEFPLGNYGLVPTIYQLDYCVPGPHPGWEEDSSNSLEEAKKTILDTTGMDFIKIAEATGFASSNFGIQAYVIIQAIPLVGGSVTGTDQLDTLASIVGTGNKNCGGGISITGCVNTKLNTKTLEKFTHIKATNLIERLMSFEEITGLFDRIYDEYVKAINNLYIPEILPSVTKENKTYFEKLPGYYKTFNGNRKTIDIVNANVTRLGNLKIEVDKLNTALTTGDFTQVEEKGTKLTDPDEITAKYEELLTPWKLAFVRMTYGMYSGDDISAAHDLTKQIVDEKDYIYKNLIKGKTGCETYLDNSNATTVEKDAEFPWQLSGGNYLDRPDYPMPHLYDYPSITTAAGKKGFLWYGAYSNWSFAIDANVKKLCNFYEQFGISNASDCQIQKGPNFLYISDLLGPSNRITPGSTKLLGGETNNFERDVLKVW